MKEFCKYVREGPESTRHLPPSPRPFYMNTWECFSEPQHGEEATISLCVLDMVCAGYGG